MRLTTPLLLLFAIALPTLAQTPAGTIKSQSEMVLVPVVVADKSGKHIGGLTRDDFSIFESGKERPLAVFEEVLAQPVVVRPPPSTGTEFSNQLGADAVKRSTILVLDALNTGFLDQSFAREELLKFLSTRVEGNEPMALLVLDARGLRVIHGFTTSPRVLVSALKKISGTISPEDKWMSELSVADIASRDLESQGLESFISGSAQVHNSFLQRENISTTLQALQHLSESFAGVPGRKSLIWITAGFPFAVGGDGALNPPSLDTRTMAASMPERIGGRDENGTGMIGWQTEQGDRVSDSDLKPLLPLYQHVMQNLSNAAIAVYPIDARGLIQFFGNATMSRLAAVVQEERHQNAIATMQAFAESTGGKAFYNRNDLAQAIRTAADQSAAYYLLGYYRDRANSKSGWRKLQVKTRREGVLVTARSGFFVAADSRSTDKDAAKEADRTKQLDIASALISPVDYTGLPLTVRFTGRAAGPKQKYGFDVVVPGISVDEANKNRVTVDFLCVALAPDAKIADQLAEHVGADLQPDAVANLRTKGLTYSNYFELAPGDYTLRFIVRDNIAGRVGSLQVPLKVR
jgi:VWFA-related protein